MQPPIHLLPQSNQRPSALLVTATMLSLLLAACGSSHHLQAVERSEAALKRFTAANPNCRNEAIRFENDLAAASKSSPPASELQPRIERHRAALAKCNADRSALEAAVRQVVYGLDEGASLHDVEKLLRPYNNLERIEQTDLFYEGAAIRFVYIWKSELFRLGFESKASEDSLEALRLVKREMLYEESNAEQLIAGSNKDLSSQWKAALSKNDAQAIIEFLYTTRRDRPLRDTALERLEPVLWQEALKEDTPLAFSRYLSALPTGAHAQEALARYAKRSAPLFSAESWGRGIAPPTCAWRCVGSRCASDLDAKEVQMLRKHSEQHLRDWQPYGKTFQLSTGESSSGLACTSGSSFSGEFWRLTSDELGARTECIFSDTKKQLIHTQTHTTESETFSTNQLRNVRGKWVRTCGFVAGGFLDDAHVVMRRALVR